MSIPYRVVSPHKIPRHQEHPTSEAIPLSKVRIINKVPYPPSSEKSHAIEINTSNAAIPPNAANISPSSKSPDSLKSAVNKVIHTHLAVSPNLAGVVDGGV